MIIINNHALWKSVKIDETFCVNLQWELRHCVIRTTLHCYAFNECKTLYLAFRRSSRFLYLSGTIRRDCTMTRFHCGGTLWRHCHRR